ncbi:MAG: phosphoribosyltransferase [Eubacterium sp.]|nr:phosphoribosyltransferase [Eubacterium sp.]
MLAENRIIKYYSRKDPNIAIKTIPGHFVTRNSHLNQYLDMTTMKTRQNEAERIAIAMKDYYNVMGKPIDTIVCLEGCEVIGAFLASELSRAGVLSMNAHKTIYVVTPEYDSNGQMFFRDNLKHEVKNRNVLLLLASATTGKTIRNSIECVEYYGGILQGISAIFSAVDSIDGHRVDALFHAEDISNYEAYDHHNCPLCKAGERIEALVNGYGYSEL